MAIVDSGQRKVVEKSIIRERSIQIVELRKMGINTVIMTIIILIPR